MNKNKITGMGFLAVLFLGMLGGICYPDRETSKIERRTLATFPKCSVNRVMSGEFSKEIEKYLADQFPFRDALLQTASLTNLYLFQKTDDQGFYEKDGCLYEEEYPLKEEEIKKATKKILEIKEQYLKEEPLYFAVIPDKSWYQKEREKYLNLDYLKVEKQMKEELEGFSYIPLQDCLTQESYYDTDLHWRQEKLERVSERLLEGMKEIKEEETYDIIPLSGFMGSYYGKTIGGKKETLYYMENEITKQAEAYQLDTQKKILLYDTKKLEGTDGYDVFLSGASALIEITSPQAKTQKELILFRDSFGSSLAPLLLATYKKITLVDLRYMPSSLLGDYIEFHGQDILFLYSTKILNKGSLLR